MADHSEFVALAQELIEAEGRAVTLQKLATSGASSTTPWKATGAAAVAAHEDTFACFLPPSGTDFGQIVTNKDLLARVDQVALVPPGTQDLSEMTVMQDGGKTWKVEWVQVLKPADMVCLYAFGVCR